MVMPYPPVLEGGAASRCAIGLMRGLAARGVECVALTAGYGAATLSPPADLPVEIVHFEPPPPTVKVRWRRRWDRLAHPLGDLSRGPFAAALRAHASHADIVHFVEAEAAQAIRLVDRPAVVQLNCLTLRDRAIGRPWRGEDRTSIELLRAELRARRRARWLLASSMEIAERLAAHARRAQVAFAPLSLDPSHYQPAASLEQPVAGLIGTANWPPTANAVRRLLTRVWPLVHRRNPAARLLLAGKGMEAAAFGLGEVPGVQWRGEVPSATAFLGELGVLLYPLSAGSGLKVKVLEAMALGVPVVSTPDGAEGLVARDGIYVANDDRAIADAAVALLGDRDARRAAGALARENFVRHHTPEPAAGPVVELYRRILA